MSDTLQNLADFQPRVVQTQAGAAGRQLADSELASVLAGPYLAHRQGLLPLRLRQWLGRR